MSIHLTKQEDSRAFRVLCGWIGGNLTAKNAKIAKDETARKPALIEKQTCENLSNEEAFQHAVNDLKTNFRAHLAFYLTH
jgi:hypothetical protein